MVNINEIAESGSNGQGNEAVTEPAPAVTVPQPTVVPTSELGQPSSRNQRLLNMVAQRRGLLSRAQQQPRVGDNEDSESGSNWQENEVDTDSAPTVTVPQPTVDLLSRLGQSSSQNQRLLNRVAQMGGLIIRPQQQPSSSNSLPGNDLNVSVNQMIDSHVGTMMDGSYRTIDQIAGQRAQEMIRSRHVRIQLQEGRIPELNQQIVHGKEHTVWMAENAKLWENSAKDVNQTLRMANMMSNNGNDSDDEDENVAVPTPEYNIPDRYKTLVCKVCEHRVASIVLMPCCHVCACKTCSGGLSSCPVCQSAILSMLETIFPTD